MICLWSILITNWILSMFKASLSLDVHYKNMEIQDLTQNLMC